MAGINYTLLLVAGILIQHSFQENSNFVRWKRNTCDTTQLKCNSGKCFNKAKLCDGTKDCEDGGDESKEFCSILPCPSNLFRCDYGACIEKAGLCNGVKNCVDGSDEKSDVCAASNSAGCSLPPQPENGKYTLIGYSTPGSEPVPGQKVPRAVLKYTCNPGFELSGSKFVSCEGRWSDPFPTCSDKNSCPPLVNPTREIECKLNDSKVECSKSMSLGTKALVKCEYFYTQVKELSRFFTVCQPNGKWSRELTSCIPKCGERNPIGLPYVAGGIEAKQAEIPWQAAIFKLIDGEYKHLCGGSIISEHAIVTAAHCFRKLDEEPDNINKYRVAVGKYYRDWNKQEKYAQILQIKEIKYHERFKGSQSNWQYNIAMTLTEEPIKMTIAVRPICVDFDKEYDRFFNPGKTGVVVGWGITESMEQSDTPRIATLQYVSMEDCEKEVPETFLPFLTANTFCAGYRNGTSVCPGDSGEGFAVQFRDGRWYLVGIVSVGVQPMGQDFCNTKHYTVFTRVTEYYDFIENNM